MDDLSSLIGARKSCDWIAHQSARRLFVNDGVVDTDELVANIAHVFQGDFLNLALELRVSATATEETHR